jgi:hypothetical protein
MERKIFNPLEWINKSPQQTIPEPEQSNQTDSFNQVVRIIQLIEEKQIDITTAYSDWRNIGFALADEFGEDGRDLFHRISFFYADYSAAECNLQFDNCLKAKGQGISLKTFFYHAKNAGIPIGSTKQQIPQEQTPMPTLPDSIYNELPEFLKRVVTAATTNEERDLLLLGSLVAISSCLPKIYGIYDSRKVFPNLYLFVTAQASAGKGRMVH